MKRYPLQTLIKLRAHRTALARTHMLEKQAAARACREQCERIEAGIQALGEERAAQRRRLLDPPPPGQPWAVAMEQREAHVELLGERIVMEQASLQQARQRLDAAERELDDARQAWVRAQAREDALHKRRDAWRGEQLALEARREEEAAADLVQARPARAMHEPQ
ncbi:hypothetical protein BGP89_05755 [Luteimonas sp. JM171]|uniref:hypothetical protein n=1 Tax=Luteimonas sp. JM171 TaxID=1896164 RepID=UPI000856AA5E|nr:hypothetical protein [Luteimonas sp. JM171]AOH35926.1 hypothetical protein BGP89_05755 [Luteimonas sp. JM171]